MPRLSVLMPVYNEERTLQAAIDRVLDVEFQSGVELEFVIVDDGSRDRTAEILDAQTDPRIHVFHQTPNQGKGAAIRRAAAEATGDYMIICDADDEYTAADIPSLVQPVLDAEGEVVYGVRPFKKENRFSLFYTLGNKGVTLATNVLFGSRIHDMETCFKLMPLALYRSLDIAEKGFGMEAEATAKLLQRGYRPVEIPIHYTARTRAEGKKITVRDGVEAIAILARIRFRRNA